MDDQTPPTPQQPAGSMQEWFKSIPEPSPVLPAPKKPRRILLFVIMAILLAASATMFALSSSRQRPITCLNAEDYKALTGQEYGDGTLYATNNFQTYLIDFKPGTADFADNTERSGPQIIDTIAKFSSSHKDKSIKLSVSSTFLDSKEEPLATQRVKYLVAELVDAGIAPNDIEMVAPISSGTEDEALEATTATITITSAKTCSESH